jgi:hypothetical protein
MGLCSSRSGSKVSFIDAPGPVVVPAPVDASGSCLDASGSCLDASGCYVDISGSCLDASGSDISRSYVQEPIAPISSLKPTDAGESKPVFGSPMSRATSS